MSSLSMVSNTTTLSSGLVVGDGCLVSNNTNSISPRGSSKNNRKRRRGTCSAAGFKGIISQPKGKWDAQIHNKERKLIWIGTFKSESEAAKAYDSVAVKIGIDDAHRNYPLTTLTSWEPEFHKLLTLEEVLTMLRVGSYRTKLYEFVSSRSLTGSANNNGGDVAYRQQLFQKVLSRSDVGNLNRFVIPKRYAEKYFITKVKTEGKEAGVVNDTKLTFFDREMKKCWKFNCCFWRSSRSYVFTGGWSQFVKDKKADAKDVVTFYMCHQSRQGHQPFYMIDVTSNGDESVHRGTVETQLGAGKVTVNESRPSDRAIQLWQNNK